MKNMRNFLAELTEKASIISALKEEKIAIFKETYSLYLVGFNDAEVRKVIQYVACLFSYRRQVYI